MDTELQWIILLRDIRKRDKISPKVGLVDQKQQEKRTISSVISLCNRSPTARNIIAQPDQYREKMYQHLLWGEDSVTLAYMTELLSRRDCGGSITMWKGSIGSKCTKKIEQCNTVLWTDKSNLHFLSRGIIFEVFGTKKEGLSAA